MISALVLIVGQDNFQSKAGLSMDIQSSSSSATPLQNKLNKISEVMGRLGVTIAILTFMVTVIITILETYKQIDRSFDKRFL